MNKQEETTESYLDAEIARLLRNEVTASDDQKKKSIIAAREKKKKMHWLKPVAIKKSDNL